MVLDERKRVHYLKGADWTRVPISVFHPLSKLDDKLAIPCIESHSTAGWGYFFVDMARSVTTTPGSPSIRPGVTAAGASETKDDLSPLGRSSRARAGFAHVVKTALHGFFMALAFLLLLPAGVLAMVSRHAGAFRRHWIAQAVAMACISVGLVLGLLLRPRLSTTHQLLGVATISAVGVQAALGAAHHMQFVRAPRRTWMARVHAPLGRLVLLAGYASVLTGLVLHRAPVFQFVVTGAIAAAEVLWMAVMAVRKRKESAWEKEGGKSADVETYQLLKEEEEE